MRVISGSARGKKLKMVPGDTTRPIMDRVKENLFNILGQSVFDSTWLDLFAGTGQVGIEALSRGARHVLFIDNSRAAIRTIKDNLAATHLAENGRVLHISAFAFLNQLMDDGQQQFDFIYVAPPQYQAMWEKVLTLIDQNPAQVLQPGGRVLVQIDPKEYQELSLANLSLADDRRYGRTQLCFYEPAIRY